MGEFVSVKYTQVNGAHFFTANDDFSDGLCVAHQDLKIALDETKVQLEKLLNLNHGIECNLEAAFTFEELKEAVDRQVSKHIRTKHVSELDWRKGGENRRAA